jgi:hypothetical protein
VYVCRVTGYIADIEHESKNFEYGENGIYVAELSIPGVYPK